MRLTTDPDPEQQIGSVSVYQGFFFLSVSEIHFIYWFLADFEKDTNLSYIFHVYVQLWAK